MNFPTPRWLKTVPTAERADAIDRFLDGITTLYVNPDAAETTQKRQRQAMRSAIAYAPMTDFELRFPSWMPKGESVERSRFLLRLAALYAAAQGTFKHLSVACGLHPNSIAVMSRRPTIPPATAKKINKLVGSGVLPLATLNPAVFGDS